MHPYMCYYVSTRKIKKNLKNKLEKLFTRKCLHIHGYVHVKSGREHTKLLSAAVSGEG